MKLIIRLMELVLRIFPRRNKAQKPAPEVPKDRYPMF